jgi:hypothetical protein
MAHYRRLTNENLYYSFKLLRMKTSNLVAALAAAPRLGSAAAQEKVLNLYTSRHYQTDEALYTTSPRRPASR